VTDPVEVVARLLAERTGLQITRGLEERLAACLEGAARAGGQTAAGYAAGLAADPGAFQHLLDCVTVQESGFFRHPDQFAALASEVLPALEGPVAVWSAGCGNGQEAYSLAMELAASGHPDWQVLATDISAAAVARTRAGRYTTAELAGIPPVHRHWLHPAGDLWEVDPALRARVRVEQANLTAGFPADPGRCQVVFCRNVLIYLSRAVAESFLARLAAWLAPGGLVFLGYAEAVLPPTRGLHPDKVGGAHVLRAVPGAGPEEVTAEEPGRPEDQARPEDQGRPEGQGGGPGRQDGPGRQRGPVRRHGPGRQGAARGLWTSTGAEFPARLRSPTGGPGADPPRWRPPAAAEGAATTTVVSFRSGGQHWAVALERVQRVLAARGLLPLPDPRPGVAGLLYRDGDTVPVLAALGGGRLGQVLVLDDHDRSFGLLVDEVIGIERVGGQPGPVPAGQRSPLVAGVLPGSDPRLLLDVAALTGWLAP
jgi:chemotaxis methyl-accepting protein methylase/chemotaxis signal transduction protein